MSRTEDVPLVQSELQEAFHRDRLDLELRSWEQLAVFHNQVVGLFGRELGIIRLIIATIVILGISNVIGMALLERRLELATFRALGLRARNIGVLLMTESLLIGVLGAGAGVLLGIGMAKIGSAIGISYPSPPGGTRPFVGGVDVAPGMVLAAATISIFAALVAAIIPVWKAVRSPIASTLRHS
jgi:putative ABC transport system permease protein